MRKKVNILLVEDDMALSTLMVRALTERGFDVVPARTGDEAMRLAQTGGFDLITLNVHLPDTNGFDLCVRMLQNPSLSDTPIVFVSGRLEDENRWRALKSGAVAYIVKPFDLNALVSLIRRHTEGVQDDEKHLAKLQRIK
jgi:DNA-binding response OmpR family regulator